MAYCLTNKKAKPLAEDGKKILDPETILDNVVKIKYTNKNEDSMKRVFLLSDHDLCSNDLTYLHIGILERQRKCISFLIHMPITRQK